MMGCGISGPPYICSATQRASLHFTCSDYHKRLLSPCYPDPEGTSRTGAWSVLFYKSITYILTAPWPSQLVDWYSWFCVLAFVGSAAFWIKATNQGLHLFSSSLIIPLMQACWTAQSIIEGGIYFDEFKVSLRFTCAGLLDTTFGCLWVQRLLSQCPTALPCRFLLYTLNRQMDHQVASMHRDLSVVTTQLATAS